MNPINLAINRGLNIHPVKPRSKEPLLNHWPEMASSDPQQIEAWQERFPGCNFGAAASDDICILESDDVNTLRDKLSRQLPETYTVQARANRPHIYFRQTAESRAAGNLDLPGIFEFKQRNRYVVAEGSVHPTGAVYTCIVDTPIREIPAWLVVDLVRLKAGSGTRMSAPLPTDGRKYGEGEGRHPMLMSQAAKLWDGKKTEEEMFEAVQALNETAPRDRAFGSSAWARKADTIMDITMDQETQVRHVQLLLRTGKAQLMEFEFRPGSGLLHQRQERLVPKIVVGEEKELTVRALAGALHIGKNRAAELLGRPEWGA